MPDTVQAGLEIKLDNNMNQRSFQILLVGN